MVDGRPDVNCADSLETSAAVISVIQSGAVQKHKDEGCSLLCSPASVIRQDREPGEGATSGTRLRRSQKPSPAKLREGEGCPARNGRGVKLCSLLGNEMACGVIMRETEVIVETVEADVGDGTMLRSERKLRGEGSYFLGGLGVSRYCTAIQVCEGMQ